jgi:hypothetical protein
MVRTSTVIIGAGRGDQIDRVEVVARDRKPGDNNVREWASSAQRENSDVVSRRPLRRRPGPPTCRTVGNPAKVI